MPHPVPIVRMIIPDAQERVLILRRQSTQYANGAWCLPGGKVEYGETLEQAVIKELHEETSLQCMTSEFLFYQDSLPLEPGKMHCVNLYFECTVSGTVILNEESDEFAWISLADVENHDIVFGNDIALNNYWKKRG